MSCEIFHGDSRKILSRFPSGFCDVTITSPPYWGMREYSGEGAVGTEPTIDLYLENLACVFREVYRCTSQFGLCWVVIGDGFTSGNRRYRAADKRAPSREMGFRPKTPEGMKPKDLLGLPWKLAETLRDIGWTLRSEIVWVKPNALPEAVKDRPNRSHEKIFLLSKSSKYSFDKTALRDFLKAGNHFIRDDVWRFSVGSAASIHMAPFPESLASALVVASGERCTRVLDPFCGSGTTGAAALKFNRDFIGIDSDVMFAEFSRNRLRSILRGSALCGPRINP